jgi:DnaD/phage-associated family protein
VTGVEPFAGFPGITRATAIPNVFFVAVLPRMRAPEELLAFLWVARLVQEQRNDALHITAAEVWANEPAMASFAAMGNGRDGLKRGLAACVELGALLALRLAGEGGEETVFFVNNPGSRRTVARARAGDLVLRPGAVALDVPVETRPGVFRMYEEHIGTITPFAGERLMEAVETYPAAWIEEAFRTAAEMNVRNWRYVERILQRWLQEGRADEEPGRDSLEEQKRRYLGGKLGHLARYR